MSFLLFSQICYFFIILLFLIDVNEFSQLSLNVKIVQKELLRHLDACDF